MAANKRPRKAYRPRPVYLNAHDIAMNRVHELQRDDVQMQLDIVERAIVERAIVEFGRGIDCDEHWRSLADATNMAEQLMLAGIGSGSDATRVVTAAQHALRDVMQRRRGTDGKPGSWTLYAAELDALLWLQALHRTQLQRCDFGEYEQALDTARNKISQARAGNAPRDAVIVEGEIR